MRFYGTGSVCAQETLLADIPLDRLELIDDLEHALRDGERPRPRYHGIGMAATGGTHSIRVDALRLGPPCHGS